MTASSSETKEGRSHAGAFGGAPFAGKYTVERILGQGGMGTVFEARHRRLGQRVAIKVLGSDLRDYPELVTRFEREARAAGALTSRHAVRVFDIDVTEDGTPFIVMELLSGADLARIVERDGPVSPARAARWVIEACDAIAEAHALGIIHRDIKPSNLFLTAEGVKVLDFGIAKRVASQEASITHAVAPLGTPQYMSPEQVRCAKDVDARSDVWSLGVTLFELVTGSTPFAHESPSACIASIAADPVPDPRELRPDLSPDFVAIILRALEKDASRRFPSVADLVAALAPFAESESVPAGAESVQALVVSAKDSQMVAALRVDATPLSDLTVPPTVSRMPVPLEGRVRRSSLALALASVIGMGVLVLSPKWASRSAATEAVAGEEVVTSAVLGSVSPPPEAAAPEAPVQAPVQAQEQAPVQAQAPAATAEEKRNEQPSVTRKVILSGRPAASDAPGRAAADASRSRSGGKISRREIATVTAASVDSPVHGGLSGPGF